jgi:hypothetical protein
LVKRERKSANLGDDVLSDRWIKGFEVLVEVEIDVG